MPERLNARGPRFLVTWAADRAPTLVAAVAEYPRPLDEEPVRPGSIDDAVAATRSRADATYMRYDEVVRPRVEAVVASCKMASDLLEYWHRHLIEQTGLDPEAHSRAAAAWLLAGRVLGLLRALYAQVEAGVCNESIVTVRALHEANRVLFAFGMPGSDDLVRVFLDDEGKHGYVKQGAARDAEARFEKLLADTMEAQGLPRLPGVGDKAEELYDRYSRFAHNRRSTILDQYAAGERRMAYGYHPSPFRRAAYVNLAASMTVDAVNMVGDAFGMFYPPGFYSDHVIPVRESIEAVRSTCPLDAPSIRAAVG